MMLTMMIIMMMRMKAMVVTMMVMAMVAMMMAMVAFKCPEPNPLATLGHFSMWLLHGLHAMAC